MLWFAVGNVNINLFFVSKNKAANNINKINIGRRNVNIILYF